ncbi:MAG: endolytic transglycosylase MltG [Elainellaceae cyanobacterium]
MGRMRFSKWLFYGAILPLTLIVCGWQGWAWWSWASAPVLSDEPADDTADDTAADPVIQIHIPQGTSARQIGRDLETAGLIRSTTAWNLWTRWQTLTNRQGGYLAGTYALSPTEPLSAIANTIWQGDVVEQSVTIPEGWSLQQMADYVEDQEWFTADEFLSATRQVTPQQYPWLPREIFQEDGAELEGFLYPDTYQFAGDIVPSLLVDQMLQRFEQVALPLYETQQSQSPFTLLEWVTLASIVEKEAVVSSERPQIAAVFARRLQDGIPLGADPTVEYALGIQQTPEQPLTLTDVNTPSPYNTYLNPGLPPGPIASPGAASLEASLVPDETNYLYFVARYDGTHIFSRTLAEHEAAQAAIRDEIASETEGQSGTAN